MFVTDSEFCGQVNPTWDSTVQKSFAFKSDWFASRSPLKTERKEKMIVAGTFKLRNGTMAIFAEKNNHRSVILIPVGASVAVVGGDVERDSFINIRYDDKLLLIRPEDLRYGIGLGSDPSTS